MIRFALALAPASEPVTLAEAKAHARIRHDRDNAQISALIVAARRRAELDTNRALVSQRWAATLDAWPAVIDGEAFRRLPLAPHNATSIISITVDGVAIDATLYALRDGEAWVSTSVADPADADALGGDIVLTFEASETDAADLAMFKLAILMNVAYWYENREAVRTDGGYPAVVAMGYDALIQPFKDLQI